MWLKDLLRIGFRIGYSTGKPFDPSLQERTDGLRDMAEKEQNRKDKKNGKQMGDL